MQQLLPAVTPQQQQNSAVATPSLRGACRVATTGLLALLCATYPSAHILFIGLIGLDIFSHWFQMYASLLAGAATHKVWRAPAGAAPRHLRASARRRQLLQARRIARQRRSSRAQQGGAAHSWAHACSAQLPAVTPRECFWRAAAAQDVHSRSWLVRAYYSNRIFMGFCCICCEVCYLSLYLLAQPGYADAWTLAVPLPGWLRAWLAASGLVPPSSLDGWRRLPGVALLAAAALPGVAVKQACNWVQLRAAAAGLVEYDIKRLR